jgi:hypothetical protein
MSKKGRARRSKIPMSIRGGDGDPVLLRGDGASTAPAAARSKAKASDVSAQISPTKLVETTSPPSSTRPRPQAPTLSFPQATSRSAKLLESLEHSTISRDGPNRDEVPRDETSRDDISVPPIGLDGGFFDEHAAAESSLEIDTRDPRLALKLTPAAARRRAQLAKYVTAAVVLACALCAAALVKITVAGGREEMRRPAAITQPAPAAEPALNAEATTERAPSPAPTAISAQAGGAESVEGRGAAQPDPGPRNTDQPAEPAAAGSVGTAAAAPPPDPALAAAAPVEVAPAIPPETPPSTSDVTPLDPKAVAKAAAKEKAKSRGALEWGKMADAIAAGERSVSLDPSDAEAWLILGAAYQQKGDAKNALRSFRACMDQGKRGPRNDCAAMLR